MRFQKGEFCQKWDFRKVNFDFQYVNFWIKFGFVPQCGCQKSGKRLSKNLGPEKKSLNLMASIIELSDHFLSKMGKLSNRYMCVVVEPCAISHFYFILLLVSRGKWNRGEKWNEGFNHRIVISARSSQSGGMKKLRKMFLSGEKALCYILPSLFLLSLTQDVS